MGRHGPGNVGGERESSLLQLSRKDAARTHLCLRDDLMLLFQWLCLVDSEVWMSDGSL